MAAGTIKLTDLAAIADPLRSAALNKLMAAHTAVDATGNTAAKSALDDLHDAMKAMDDAYVGLPWATGTQPQPQEGPEDKPPRN